MGICGRGWREVCRDWGFGVRDWERWLLFSGTTVFFILIPNPNPRPMRPRIVILSAFATPYRSGAEACAEEVSRELLSRYDITIVTSRLSRSLPKRGALPGGVPVVRVGLGTKLDPWLFPFLAPFAVRSLKPQIVHAVLESFAGLALVLCKTIYPSGVRLLTLQSTNTSFLLGPMHRAANRMIAISSVLVERAKTFGRTDVVLIPNGIPSNVISKACVQHSKEANRILFVGRLERVKGVDILLKAVSRLPKELQWSLHIVGDGSQGSSIELLVQELGLSDKVTMHGYLSSDVVYDEFAKAEIFCGLSRSEALGNVFLEAQAAGCAVIATNMGGIPDSVKNGETGLLVSVESVDEAVSALEKCLSDESLKKRLAEAGRKNAERYDWSAIAEKYEEVYTQML